MTQILLIRHASHDWLAQGIAGRAAGIHLNNRGQEEARHLAEHLEKFPIAKLFSSPSERARESAEPIARLKNLPITTSAALDERLRRLDEKNFRGTQTRRALERMGEPTQQRAFAARPIGEAQTRIVAEIKHLAHENPDATIALVSHGDLIRAALAHYLAIHLDNLERFEIAPASVSKIAIGEGWSQVRTMNVSP